MDSRTGVGEGLAEGDAVTPREESELVSSQVGSRERWREGQRLHKDRGSMVPRLGPFRSVSLLLGIHGSRRSGP